MRLSLFLAAALFCAAPAGATPTLERNAGEVAGVSAELSAYGDWLLRVGRLQAPVQEATVRLQGEWRSAMAGPDIRSGAERFRPFILEFVAAVDRSNAALAGVDTPEFPTLFLDADLEPAALVRDARELNLRLRSTIQAFGPLLDAMGQDDPAAMQAASTQLMASLNLFLESRLRMARAGEAATPRDESNWEVGHVEILLLRALQRALAAWPVDSRSGTDSTLASDLAAIAVELDRTADDGAAKSEAEKAQYSELLAEARGAGDRDGAVIYERALAVLAISRRTFPLARDFAAILRREAVPFQGGLVPTAALLRLVNALQPIRAQLDELGSEAAVALAGTN